MDSSTSTPDTNENVFIFIFIASFILECVYMFAVGNQILNRTHLLKLIKRRSKVHQRNMSQERSLTFNQ